MIDVPPIDPERERQLLEAFDRHVARARSRRWPAFAAATAVSLSTAALIWVAAIFEPVAPPIANPRLAPPLGAPSVENLPGFVPWPGAGGLPPFESGEVRRVDIPASVLPEAVLPVSLPPATIVRADILVGRDGYARAVKLVQGQGAQQ